LLKKFNSRTFSKTRTITRTALNKKYLSREQLVLACLAGAKREEGGGV